MLPLLILAEDPVSDARLAPPMTFAERYLPLRDFAARIRTATRVPIKIDGDMAERKLALFVDGRPLAESMRMAANALGDRWVRIGPEWHLRPDLEVARDEAAEAEAEDSARRASVLAWAQGFAHDPGPSGAVPAVTKASALVAKMGAEAATDVLLNGRSIIATTSGRDGTVQIPLDGTSDTDAPDGLLSLRLPKGGNLVTIHYTPLGAAARGGGLVAGSVVPPMGNGGAPAVYNRHAESWGADTDPKATSRPLDPLPLGPEPYSSGLESLADALARLHARSGLPVAAESFRAPLCAYAEIPGGTVGESLAGLVKEVQWTKSRFSWRSERGWILARPARPWAYRPGEIPESALRPLEGKDPGLDAYADLAASLNEPQIEATAHARPLARFSTGPFSGFANVRTLAAFGTLSPTERRLVRSEGLLYARMSPVTRARWDQAYGDIVLENPSNDGTYLDLLGGKRPEDAGLRVKLGFSVSHGTPDRAPDWNAPEGRYVADEFLFRLDPHSGFSLVIPVPRVPIREWAAGS